MYLGSDSVVLFKGTKLGVAEGVTMPMPVASVNLKSGEEVQVSEQQKTALWEMVENCGAVELSTEQKEQFYLLLLSNSDVFAEDGQPGRTNLVKHRVETRGHPPIRQPLRRLPPYKREEAKHLIQDMFNKDIIRPSSSPWASRITLVPKKDGTLRFVLTIVR